MGQPFVRVNYDFGAADRLCQVLAAGSDKISALAKLRADQRASLLGGPTSDNWQGAKRNEFERQFTPEQRALAALADDLKRLASAVNTATAQAHAINARTH
jgi:uncharacterized protein YukE